MSWHFSRALVEAYSEGTCSDGAPSAPSNTNPTPLLYSSSDKMMEFCSRSQSGMTCEPLTASLGADVLTWFLGGFPCQDISAAGAGTGITGERSGLWKEMARIVREVRPRYVFVENSPLLADRGLGVVLGDLAEMGFDAEWGVYGSIDAELPALRERLWIVASSVRNRLEGAGLRKETGKRLERQTLRPPKKASHVLRGFLQRFDASGLFGDADGMAGWVERLKATGNGQVPAVAARAFAELSARMSR